MFIEDFARGPHVGLLWNANAFRLGNAGLLLNIKKKTLLEVLWKNFRLKINHFEQLVISNGKMKFSVLSSTRFSISWTGPHGRTKPCDQINKLIKAIDAMNIENKLSNQSSWRILIRKFAFAAKTKRILNANYK